MIVEAPGLVASDLGHLSDLRNAYEAADERWTETVEHVGGLDAVLDRVAGSCADVGETRIVLDRLHPSLSTADRLATLQRFGASTFCVLA